MSWFLVHKQGMSLVSGEGIEEKFYNTGSLSVESMAKLAGSLVINMSAERPPMKPSPTPTKPPGTTAAPKPPVTWSKSPNFSARTSRISRIILHYTTESEVSGSLDWFSRPESEVSAHYVVDRDGTIYQCVSDERKAWHAKGENDDSLGIEHVAGKGQTLTSAQSEASAALIRYLKAQYHIDNDDITGHRFTPANIGRTDCPGHLWKTESDLKEWLRVMAPDAVQLPGGPLAVPYFSQYNFGGDDGDSICGCTSMAMVLKFLGKDVTPDTVLEAHKKASCQSPEGCKAVFKKYGFAEAFSTKVGTWAQVNAYLSAGIPLILNGYFTSPGHILVATKIDGDHIICNDPAGVWDQRVRSTYRGRPTNGKGVRYRLDWFMEAVGKDGDVWFAAPRKV